MLNNDIKQNFIYGFKCLEMRERENKRERERIPCVQVTDRKERYTSLAFTILVNTLKAGRHYIPRIYDIFTKWVTSLNGVRFLMNASY